MLYIYTKPRHCSQEMQEDSVFRGQPGGWTAIGRVSQTHDKAARVNPAQPDLKLGVIEQGLQGSVGACPLQRLGIVPPNWEESKMRPGGFSQYGNDKPGQSGARKGGLTSDLSGPTSSIKLGRDRQAMRLCFGLRHSERGSSAM